MPLQFGTVTAISPAVRIAQDGAVSDMLVRQTIGDVAVDDRVLWTMTVDGQLVVFSLSSAPSGGGNVITGSQDDPSQTSISATLAGPGSSIVTDGFGAIAIGESAEAHTDPGDSGALAIGYLALARKHAAIALGRAPDAKNIADVVIGSGASTQLNLGTAGSNVAIGNGARAGDTLAGADSAVAIGEGAQAIKQGSVTIGLNFLLMVPGQWAVSLGFTAQAGSDNSVAVGPQANAGDATNSTTRAATPQCTALGHQANATGLGATALGAMTDATADGALAIGADSSVNGAQASGVDSTAIGGNAQASAIGAVAIGDQSAAAAPNAVSLGHAAGALGSGGNSTALGHSAQATADFATALGDSTSASAAGAVAIGADSSGSAAATATGTDDFVLGTSLHKVSVPGLFGVHGATPVAQSATPVTLADVIAILQAHGFCA